jgi:acyl dehydratase
VTAGRPRSWRLSTPPLGLERLRAFSALVNDPNPVHVDPEFAQGLGLPGAVAQGGLVVSVVSRMLVAEGVRELDVRLLASVPAGTALVCEGTTRDGTDEERTVDCVVRDAHGVVYARATALLGKGTG